MRSDSRQLDDVRVSEPPAVEVQDVDAPEVSALAHRIEQVPQVLRQSRRFVLRSRQQVRKKPVRQQADVFGEHAEPMN